MSTSVSSATATSPTASRATTQATNSAAPARPAAASDRVATAPALSAPLLTIGAAALAQLVPGVMEFEGASAIATTIGIGVRAAMSNPAVGIGLGIAGTEALGYAKTLAHDAFSMQPGYKPMADLSASLDSSIRAGLGIPPSSDH